MKQQDIIQGLKAFKKITPSDEFSARSKRYLLTLPRKSATFDVPDIVSRPLGNVAVALFSRRGMQLAWFAIAIVLVISGTYVATRELSPLFLPGLSHSKITAEAEAVNDTIQIELGRINYFQQASQESEDALTHVTQNTPDHLNKSILNREASSMQNAQSSPIEINQEINSLLEYINE